MVTSLILSIMIIATFLVLSIGQGSWIRGDVNIQVRQEIARALITMGKELKSTRPSKTNIASGASSNSITFNVPKDLNGDGNIIDSSGKIEWSPNITYSLNGSNQIVRVASGNTSIIANKISSLLFSRPVGKDSNIEIDITASAISQKGQAVQDTDTSIILMRN